MSSIIEKDAVVLFQGDSITDAGRNRDAGDDMGHGYASMAAALFSSLYPQKGVQFINRGIGGNRVIDLKERWTSDCLDLRPTWVSIMIGINDCWHRFSRNAPTSVEAFASTYHDILTDVKQTLDAKLIIMEPFLLPYPEDRKQWREDLDPKIHVVRELATEFDAHFIPLDGIFAEASTRAPASFWTTDGVHPTPAGHALIARTWLHRVRAL